MDEYPTEDELLKIKEWPDDDPVGLMQFIADIWNYPDYVKIKGKNVIHFELHTGGWSGNEEIISALEGHMFWFAFWVKSVHGGHYYFELPRWATKLKGEAWDILRRGRGKLWDQLDHSSRWA